MDVDPQELQTDMAVNHIEQMEQNEQDVTMMPTDGDSPTARGDVLKILGQTIHDGGAVKYTVFWENRESTEVRISNMRTMLQNRREWGGGITSI